MTQIAFVWNDLNVYWSGIVIAAAVLYMTNAQMLPLGVLVAGALLAVAALVMAIIKMVSATG